MRLRVAAPSRQDQGEEDDTEVYVNRLIQDQLPQAITRKLLRKETSKDETLQMLMEDIKLGKCRPALHRYQQVFEELALVDGLVVRGSSSLFPWRSKGRSYSWRMRDTKDRIRPCSG